MSTCCYDLFRYVEFVTFCFLLKLLRAALERLIMVRCG